MVCRPAASMNSGVSFDERAQAIWDSGGSECAGMGVRDGWPGDGSLWTAALRRILCLRLRSRCSRDAVLKGKKGKAVYSGPTTIVVLAPTPMLDNEGKQRVDPDGKLMFNPPVQQIRDKKGHPVFDADGKPVFQTANDLGFDEKGKKIKVKKEKPPQMTPLSDRRRDADRGWMDGQGAAELRHCRSEVSVCLCAGDWDDDCFSRAHFRARRSSRARFNGQYADRSPWTGIRWSLLRTRCCWGRSRSRRGSRWIADFCCRRSFLCLGMGRRRRRRMRGRDRRRA